MVDDIEQYVDRNDQDDQDHRQAHQSADNICEAAYRPIWIVNSEFIRVLPRPLFVQSATGDGLLQAE